MRRTLVNLEMEEKSIVDAYKKGETIAGGMRTHLNNIRKHALYEAVDGCDNFEQYVKLKRLPISGRSAYRMARQAEVIGHLVNCHARQFSGESLDALGTVRQDNDDGTRSHDLHVKRMKSVADKCITHHEKTGEPITGPLVKQVIEGMPWDVEKPAPTFEQLSDREIKRVGKLKVSFAEFDADVFLDAEVEYPGSVTRLAKAYSDLASQLRKVLK